MRERPEIGAKLKEFQRKEVERILGACTQCGKCFEVCPMTKYSKAPATDGKAVVPGVLAVLRGEKGSAEALGWIAVCYKAWKKAGEGATALIGEKRIAAVGLEFYERAVLPELKKRPKLQL
ncbi:MAG: 4Fe-4S dicluster domain-containing protein [Betaproteobacteria bacterium]